MSNEITLEVEGLKELVAAFKKAPEIVGGELDGAIQQSAVQIQRETMVNAPVDTGQLRSQIEYRKTGNAQAVVGSKAKHSLPVHEGSKPHYAPLKALEPWARRKGIPVGAVWYSIAKKGTKANPFMKKAVDSLSGQIDSNFTKALVSVTSKLSK